MSRWLRIASSEELQKIIDEIKDLTYEGADLNNKEHVNILKQRFGDKWLSNELNAVAIAIGFIEHGGVAPKDLPQEVIDYIANSEMASVIFLRKYMDKFNMSDLPLEIVFKALVTVNGSEKSDPSKLNESTPTVNKTLD